MVVAYCPYCHKMVVPQRYSEMILLYLDRQRGEPQDAFDISHGPYTAPGIATNLKLPIATVYRTIAELKKKGLVKPSNVRVYIRGNTKKGVVYLISPQGKEYLSAYDKVYLTLAENCLDGSCTVGAKK